MNHEMQRNTEIALAQKIYQLLTPSDISALFDYEVRRHDHPWYRGWLNRFAETHNLTYEDRDIYELAMRRVREFVVFGSYLYEENHI